MKSSSENPVFNSGFYEGSMTQKRIIFDISREISIDPDLPLEKICEKFPDESKEMIASLKTIFDSMMKIEKERNETHENKIQNIEKNASLIWRYNGSFIDMMYEIWTYFLKKEAYKAADKGNPEPLVDLKITSDSDDKARLMRIGEDLGLPFFHFMSEMEELYRENFGFEYKCLVFHDYVTLDRFSCEKSYFFNRALRNAIENEIKSQSNQKLKKEELENSTDRVMALLCGDSRPVITEIDSKSIFRSVYQVLHDDTTIEDIRDWKFD